MCIRLLPYLIDCGLGWGPCDKALLGAQDITVTSAAMKWLQLGLAVTATLKQYSR